MSEATAPPPASGPIRRRVRPLGALTPGIVGPVFSKRGFAGADLAVHWPDIVGSGVANHSRPLGLQWPKGGGDTGLGATLTIACTGAFALDLQQMTPVILERLNRRLGWRCVTRITIRQMPVRAPQPKPVVPKPAAEDEIAAGRIAAGIATDNLRDAMTRLGAGVLARARRQSLTKA